MKRKIDWTDRSILERAVEGSVSRREILEKLGYSVSSSAYKSLAKWSEFHELELPVYNYKENTNFLGFFNTVPDEEVFCENSRYRSGTSLKKRLIEKGWDYLCARKKCPTREMNGLWLDEPLILQLEHKNGINTDNRYENLEFLCSNCHTQTPTFSGRNNKNKKPEVSAEERLLRRRKSNPFKIDWPPSSELLARAAEIGYTALGKELGVSDNAIRKHLIHHPV